MIGYLALVTWLVVAQPAVATNPSISPDIFRASFASAVKGELAIPKEIRHAARGFRYVFVAGFMNEGMSDYFKQNARELRAMGVPRRAIHYIEPSSRESIDGNATAVRARFLEIAARGPEKLVVIAHSRGACDALAFALSNPQFVSEHIQALFLIQGPFGGSGLADYVTGEGPPIDNRMPLKHRLIALALGRLEEAMLAKGKHAGLATLTRRASKEFWENALEKHREAIPVVSPKTFYVTSKTQPAHLRLFLKATAWYLGTHFGPNDGMVALEDQTVAGLGTVLAVLDAGHTDLTHHFPSAIPKHRLRRALVDAVVMGVGKAATAH